MSNISLVMATLGRTSEILDFIKYLKPQCEYLKELIIVDQNDDERLSVVDAEAKMLPIKYLRIKESIKNLSHARNVGIKSASGEIIAFPDDDCWYAPDVLKRVKEKFDLHDSLSILVTGWIERPIVNKQVGFIPNELILDFRGCSFASIMLFMRRSDFYKAYGFDPRLGTGQWFGASEEHDLIFRMLISGCKLYNDPHIHVHHPFNKNISLSRIKAYSRGTGALYSKLDLSKKTIFRGLISPLLRCFSPPYSLFGCQMYLNQAYGRIEGFLFWIIKYGYGQKSWQSHADTSMFNQ